MVSDFGCSVDELEVDPLPAVPLAAPELGLDDEAPPPDGLFWSELEDGLDGEELDGEAPMLEDDEEPDGEDGVEVAPLEDEEPEGEEDGLVVEDDDPVAARSFPARSQAVSRLAPSAMETAIARVDSLIVWPPWLG